VRGRADGGYGRRKILSFSESKRDARRDFS
jgi:hypothetical protein